MGPLNLPVGGSVYIDAQIVSYTVNLHRHYAPLLRPLWSEVASGRVRAETSELTLLRHQRLDERARVEHLLSTSVTPLPITRDVLIRAAEMRAQRSGLRTPDAIHLATAEQAGSSTVLTNDRRLRSTTALAVVTLQDLHTPSP